MVDTIWVACLKNKKNKVNGRGDWRWCVGNNSLITLSILVTPKKVKITLGRKLTSLRSANFSPLGNFDYFRSYILLLVIRVYYYLLDQFVNRKKEGNLNPNYPLKLKKKGFFSKNVYFSKKIILHLFIYFSFIFFF